MALLEEPVREPKTVKNYINGEWVESSGPLRDVTNPATGKLVARVPISTGQETNAAIAAAQAAFPAWRTTPPVSRARYLFRLKELLEQNFEEISRIQTQEHGKTIDESRGETRRGIENVEVACGIPTMMMGQNLEDIASGIDEFLIRQPLGVFGIIAPFNFPFMIPLWSAPYAIATGNCVVIKPSPEVPLSQMRLAELVEEAGLPPGVWNVVNGDRETVNAMLDCPSVAGITFVGRTTTARDVICKRCGETGKRVIAQGSAKNFMVIMPDCNVEKTVPAMMTSFFGNTGQRCLSGANLLIVGKDDRFYNDFVKRTVDAASKIVIGYGLDESVQMGPVHDKGKKDRIMADINSAAGEGAKLILDGSVNLKINGSYPDECFLGPTILENVKPTMRICREEVFGPVMGIMRATDLDEAIELCNASRYGNGNAIFTSSGKSAREFQYRATSGNVGINVGIVAPMAFFPFSGMKDSFFGILHTQGQEAVRFFTESKVVIQRWL
jgi:malonate-semialdehyde dehydrogenase (acetylating)/methylmalonate-semialdehyde dehydrogenase